MFDGRIYRAALAPLLLVLLIVGFSLASQPAPLSSTLAPDAFDGARSFANLQALTREFPDRRPGGAGDDRLAARVAQTLHELNGSAGGGFQISTHRLRAQTFEGARTLTTVIAERPGSSGLSPIAIVAHRDAVATGSEAELSGTAVLLELARVFSQSETRRTIVLVSTSGGSGGYAGAADFARHGPMQPLDATVVLGDLATSAALKPFVMPFSAGVGMAPESLVRTFDAAISQQVGVAPGELSTVAQFAHLALPLAGGEEAPLNAAGIPSVLVQSSGERPPSPNQPVSATRLQSFGRAVLSATYALDEGANIASPSSERLRIGRKVLPTWAIRLFALALLLAPLLVCVDALARLRRRREPILRWLVWALSGALPFLVCALFAILLGRLGIVAAPGGQLPPRALSLDDSASVATVSAVLVLVLALLAYPALMRRLALPLRPSADGAALAAMLTLLAVALLTWIVDPFATLLLAPAAHLWLLALGPCRERAGPRARAAALMATLTGVLPAALLLIAYARELGLGPGGVSESAVLALAGGQVGPFWALLWSIALGSLLAVVLLNLQSPAVPVGGARGLDEWAEISTRGPSSYAGPGSLGGVESALRR